MRERVIDALAGEGYLMDQEAEDYIMAQPDPLHFAHKALRSMQERPLIITMRDLRKVCVVPSEKVRALQEVPQRRLVEVESRDHGDITVTKDITNASNCDASVAGFANYFMDRFETLRGMLQKRRDLVGASTIDRGHRDGQRGAGMSQR
jgi:DNA polymerase II small subunit/DNA polymerase delta subunit B